MCDNARKQCPLLMNLGGRLIWIILMECLDHVGCIGKVFRWFPACGIRGVVEPFPLDEIEQPQPVAMAVESAVKDPINLPLI